MEGCELMHPRVQILTKIDELQNEHCQDCEKVKEHRKLTGNGNGRDTFCNTQCDVGNKIQKLGQLLLENKAKTVKPKKESKIKILRVPKKEWNEMNKIKKELTKEAFLDLTASGKTNKQIMEMYGMNNVTFYKLKNKWGLVKNQSKKTEKVVKSVTVDEKKEAPEVKITHEVPKEKSITNEKSCDCKVQLHEKILSLQSELALQKKENEDLVHCIAGLQKYKKLYFTTVETLKIHLP